MTKLGIRLIFTTDPDLTFTCSKINNIREINAENVLQHVYVTKFTGPDPAGQKYMNPDFCRCMCNKLLSCNDVNVRKDLSVITILTYM